MGIFTCDVGFSIVKYVPPDGFFGIQILLDSISAVAVPRSPLGELTTLPRPPSPLRRGIHSPHFPPPRRLRRLAHRASPFFKTFHRPCHKAHIEWLLVFTCLVHQYSEIRDLVSCPPYLTESRLFVCNFHFGLHSDPF